MKYGNHKTLSLYNFMHTMKGHRFLNDSFSLSFGTEYFSGVGVSAKEPFKSLLCSIRRISFRNGCRGR